VEGQIGRSLIAAEIRWYHGEDYIEVRLRVTWLETQRLLRLLWPQPAGISGREDGVSGGALRRASDGVERPVHDRTLLRLGNGTTAGAVFPDTYSLSGSERELRLTLLRSAVMAHHAPHPGVKERRVISDQGPQDFTFYFFPRLAGGSAQLDELALGRHRPPVVADLTRGMPLRPARGRAMAAPFGPMKRVDEGTPSRTKT
jgi:alpha-mannosidase